MAIMLNALAALTDDELRWLIMIVIEHERQRGAVITPAALRAIMLRGQP